jgi:hypothetical protein
MNYDVLRFYNVIYQSWFAVHTQQLPNSNRIGGELVRVLASSVVDRGFEPRSGQTKDNTIGICCFSAKNVALKRKSKDWLTQNQDNVFEWGDMSIRGLLFQ